MTRRLPIGDRPVASPQAEDWVKAGIGGRPNVYSARLTIDVTPELRGRIKVRAFRRGITVAELLRELLEREFSGEEEAR
jgi:hypothetical protein